MIKRGNKFEWILFFSKKKITKKIASVVSLWKQCKYALPHNTYNILLLNKNAKTLL